MPEIEVLNKNELIQFNEKKEFIKKIISNFKF